MEKIIWIIRNPNCKKYLKYFLQTYKAGLKLVMALSNLDEEEKDIFFLL
jgi:hypothetical protein